ncbi:MAG TPA: DUF6134 family protein [Longimicrobiales bacterium]|nr:DUF6134 family protein [Longimicrobiales bacterium]
MTNIRAYRTLLALGLLAAGAAFPLHGQVVPLDDAIFVLYRQDTVVGDEHVTLHRMGLGQAARIIGQSEVRMQDGTEMRPRVEASPEMRPTTYQNKFTGAEAGEVMLSRSGRRLVARTQTATGESQREFRISDRTVILEPQVVLLYYLLRPWAETPDTEITALDPRTGAQQSLMVRVVGAERLRVGRVTVEAQRIRLEGGDQVTEVWFDEEGRVLRVEIPALGFRAERKGN